MTDSNLAGLLRLLEDADDALTHTLVDQVAALAPPDRARIEDHARSAPTAVRIAVRRARIRAAYNAELPAFRAALARRTPDLERALVTLGRAAGAGGVSEVTTRLDALAEQVGQQLSGDRAFDTGLAAIGEVLHKRHRLRGNEANYHHPSNSYLQTVLETGLGIPISLCVIAVLVGRRLELPVNGVSTPGHFLGYYGDADLGIGTWFDPFSGFARISESQARAIVARYADDYAWSGPRAAPDSEILARCVNNLVNAWTQQGDSEHARNLAEWGGSIPL